MGISDYIYNLFGSNGEIGLLLCIFLIFLLDAFLVPTLPELFFILAFMGGTHYRTPLVFGCELLVTAILAEVIGALTLYYVVSHVRIPKKIDKAIGAYTKFLIVGDERLLLLNRVAPMVPFVGAFIYIAKWNLAKSMRYILLGCIIKYGVIMLLSNQFYTYFASDKAQWITLVMIVVVIAVSMILSFAIKKRHMKDDSMQEQQ